MVMFLLISYLLLDAYLEQPLLGDAPVVSQVQRQMKSSTLGPRGGRKCGILNTVERFQVIFMESDEL